MQCYWLEIRDESDRAVFSPFVIYLSLGNEMTIGRDLSCDLCLPSRHISREHIRLTLGKKGLRVADLKSTSGILVNGKRVADSYVCVGDKVSFANCVLIVSDRPTLLLQTEKALCSATYMKLDLSVQRFLTQMPKISEPKELLKELLQLFVMLFDAKRGFVLLDDGRKELVPVAAHAVDAKSELFAISNTICQAAIENGNTIFVKDTSKDKWYQSASRNSIPDIPRTVICCPLFANNQTYGVIYVDGNVEITDEHKSIFEMITILAAHFIAATNTRQQLFLSQERVGLLTSLVVGKEEMFFGEDTRELQKRMLDIARMDVSVLVTGDTGTGKEMVARTIHRASSRCEQPFIAVNCAALPETIIENELFGSERGAFSGASSRKIGRFELANKGTLFLDEVGELPLSVQVKLLRVLEDKYIRRLGGSKQVQLDFRLICATNKKLEQLVAHNLFRSDLYYRINVFPLNLPTLSCRRHDIIPLAEHFLEIYCKKLCKNISAFSEAAKSLLMSHYWPGNVRELRNVIERAVVVERSNSIQSISLQLIVRSSDSVSAEDIDGQEVQFCMPENYNEALDIFEMKFFEEGLKKHDGSISSFAQSAGLSRITIYRKIKKFGIEIE